MSNFNETNDKEINSYISKYLNTVLRIDDRGDTLVATIAETIGRDIIEGRRNPGDDLNTVDLAREFNSSRTPIREALLILEKEGLVQVPARRRPRVALLDIQQIREIYQIRTSLHQLVAELVVKNATDEEINSLGKILEKMVSAVANHDIQGYFWLNVSFHIRAGEICGNETLRQLINSFGLQTLKMRYISLSQPNRNEESAEDHIRLLRAFRERDEILAATISRSNLKSALL